MLGFAVLGLTFTSASSAVLTQQRLRADVIDAMTSVRPYRKPVSFEQAMQEIETGAGKHFDPDLCALAREAFVDVPIDLLDSSIGL